MTSRIIMVVPCYNEKERLPIDYWRKLIQINAEIHWIFVDDGSTDKTSNILERLSEGTGARVVRIDRNVGKGNAILHGFRTGLSQLTDVDYCGFIDSDGAFSEGDVRRLIGSTLDKMSEYEVLISSRVALSGRKIDRKIHRHYLGRVIATLLTYSWPNAPYDTQSGFKVFSNSESFQKAILQDCSTKWFSDVELISRIGTENGGKIDIWEEPLMQWRDVNGSSLKKRDSILIIRELIIARRAVRNLVKLMEKHGLN